MNYYPMGDGLSATMTCVIFRQGEGHRAEKKYSYEIDPIPIPVYLPEWHTPLIIKILKLTVKGGDPDMPREPQVAR